MANNDLPAHLQPQNCYVCGGAEHAPTETHQFWSNRDAQAEFAQRDDADQWYYDPAAAYVEEHIGR